MPNEIGRHLLGRLPSPPDERDYKAAWFLPGKKSATTHKEIVTRAREELKQTTVGFKNKYWVDAPEGTHWYRALALLAQIAPEDPIPVPPPPPPPTPTPTDVSFTDTKQLDQGDTGHCVGFGWAQWGNSQPIEDNFTNDDGHAIYYECKVIDGEPRQENGSYVRSGAKAMQDRKRDEIYAFASTIQEIRDWVQAAKGPVVVGTDWYNDMFDPDREGYVTPTGGNAGGHCFLLIGDLESEGAFLFQNSWGANWGLNGYFKMKYEDFDKLLQADGEACVTVELPLEA